VKSRLLHAPLAIAAAALAGGAFGAFTTATSSPSSAQMPRAKHVIVVMFENRNASQVLQSTLAPSFRRLAERYATLEHYDAVAHPSLPNYLALISGSTHGLRSDCSACTVSAPNLADTLAAHSLTWKAYVEDRPRQLVHFRNPAVKARIPFLYFRDVRSSRRRMRDIVPLAAFRADLGAHRLPSFSLVVPDLCHDMHNCPIATGDRWLASFMRPLSRPGVLSRTVVFVTFDEARAWFHQGGGGPVAAIVVGPLVRKDSLSVLHLDHYSLLRTIEQAWHLPLLGRSATAPPITGIWR
jgi:phospholipase C